MGTNVWCLVIPILLLSTNAELHDVISESFYETPQFSSPSPLPSLSPSPLPSLSPSPGLQGMKEVVLFLTPDQAESLRNAGALVRPFPEYNAEFANLHQQFKQTVDHQYILQQQTPAPRDQNQEPGLENYFRLLNIQEINDDLALHQQAPDIPAETPAITTIKTVTSTTIPLTIRTTPISTKPTPTTPTQTTLTSTTPASTTPTATTPRYKYAKSRQQNKEKEYFTTYVPKKANRPKVSIENNNSEYVRFLPNYETESLKMVPFYALPLSPYRFENVGTRLFNRVNDEPHFIIHSPINEDDGVNVETHSELKSSYASEFDKKINETKTGNQQQFEDVVQSTVETQNPIETETEIPQAIVEVPAPVILQRPEKTQTLQSLQESTEVMETLESVEGPLPVEEQQEKPETPKLVSSKLQTSIPPQDQVSRLLAPLYQHQTITETIAQQREELLNTELQIHSQLQQIKQTSQQNDQEYSSILQLLTNNFENRNALSNIQGKSKSPRVFINQQPSMTESSPVEVQRHVAPIPIPVLVRVPTPFDLNEPTQHRLQFVRPIPVPVQQASNIDLTKAVQVEAGTRVPVMIRHSYFKVNKPQISAQKVPLSVKHEFPVKVNVQKPEQMTIIRHIWEH